ncbi:MAG: phytanoyl-CoA dioxygenase family protein [Candidatus Methylacidiphilales bacterium]|nr:phytanoyl-CoA dioxygenase family protein [Candidatus Methylacidiphilales bacterium]
MTATQLSTFPTTAEPALPGKRLLTAAQKQEFDNNGFFIVRNALNSAEVEHLLEVTDRADREVANDVKGARKEGAPLELRNAVTFDQAIVDMITHNIGLSLILDLMGPSIQLTTSHLFIRPPSPANVGSAFKQIDWHRDGPSPRPMPVNGIEPWLYTKIGYFLTDTTIPNAGALRVVPGSHRYGGPAPSSEANGSDPYGAIEAQVRPGDAIIFENRLLHAVGPNFSQVARKNLYLGYSWRYLRAIDYVTQSQELIARSNPFERQLLGDASEALHYYLPGKAGLALSEWRPIQ